MKKLTCFLLLCRKHSTIKFPKPILLTIIAHMMDRQVFYDYFFENPICSSYEETLKIIDPYFTYNLEKEKLAVQNLKAHAAVGEFDKEKATEVFEDEYGKTEEIQIQTLYEEFGFYPSQFPKKLWSFVTQGFIDRHKTFIENLNQSNIILSRKNLFRIPRSIQFCTNIKTIYFYMNGIIYLTNSMKALIKLEYFSCSNNQLMFIPLFIDQWCAIKKLNLKNNQIKYIPNTIGNCINLEELDLTNNQIEHLPDSITNCKKLKKLRLASNKISKLPQDIGNCTTLKELSFGNKNFESLPESMKKLEKLETLSLTYMGEELSLSGYQETQPFLNKL